MTTLSKSIAAVFAGVLLNGAIVFHANACSIQNMQNWNASKANANAQFAQAFNGMERNQNQALFDWPFHTGIVGLWKFTFTAEGNAPPLPPDGTVLDAGFQTWHIDNTELMNSGRPAATGDFCMGVWRQGSGVYTLNHFAMAWNPPGTDPSDFAGIANIRAQVKLSRDGNSFSGTETLDQYQPDGVTLAVHLTGTITATRVTTDSTVDGN